MLMIKMDCEMCGKKVQIFNANAKAFPMVRDAMLILKIRSISGKGSEEETGKAPEYKTARKRRIKLNRQKCHFIIFRDNI